MHSMARFRRIAAVAGVAMIAGAVVGMPAQADSPEVFFGSAAGKALDLVVLDTQASFGASQATADSTGAATASGAGAILPLPDVDPDTGTDEVAVPAVPDLKTVGGQSADASKADPDVKSKKCVQPSDDVKAAMPDDVEKLVNVGIVCSSAEARKSGGPSAKGEASLAGVGLNADFAVEQLDEAIGEEGAALLGTICAAIDDALPADVEGDTDDDAQEGADDATETACGAKDTLADVVTNVFKTSTVLDAAVGKTTSSVTTEASKVTSTATAAGATIKVLPLPELDALPSTDPLVTVAVSQASATAVYDRGTGAATASFDPALVRIKFNPVVMDSLPPVLMDALAQAGIEPGDEIVVTSETLLDQGATVPSQSTDAGDETVTTPEQDVMVREHLACGDDPSSICLSVGPLQVRIRVGNGRVVTNADGSVKAVADGVSVEASIRSVDLDLPDESPVDATPGAAVTMAFAHAEAATGGQAARFTTSSDPGDGDNGNGPGDGGNPELSRTLPPAELPRTGGTPWIPLVGATALSLAVIGRRVAAKATR
jgi:hypothetical protein